MLRKARLLLVQVDRHQLEIHRRPVPQHHQHVEHGVGILAPTETDQDPIALLDHVEVRDGTAGFALQFLLEAL